jgi:hypothetical protein
MPDKEKDRRVSDESASQASIPQSTPVKLVDLSEYMAEIGRKGGRVGGKVRLKSMTKEQRRKAAAKAARARWKNR